MIVMCQLLVVLCAGITETKCVNVMTKLDVSGYVITSDSLHYVVNFSKECKKHGCVGDYSSKLVDRTSCVVLDGN